MHARLVADNHVCAHCRWGLTTGLVLQEDDPDDRYLWELITQMLLDMYRHLAPSTVRGYAREVNLMRDFQRAVPGIELADVMGGAPVDVSTIHVSTTHAMLWLHLERSTGISYGAIRRTRSVYSKLCELGGTTSALSVPGCEFKRFTKAFRMRVGTGSIPSPALSVGAWFDILRYHGDRYEAAIGSGDRRGARDALCALVHSEVSFLGFLRPAEQTMMQREDVAHMLCNPSLAAKRGVKPFVVLPLMGPTKTSTNEAAGVVICWTTRGGIRVGEHVAALLGMYAVDGEPTGALFTHGPSGRAWTPTYALHHVVRPAIGTLRERGEGDTSVTPLQSYTLNTFRRGGNSHARDRGAKRWECTAHGRWEGQWEKRDVRYDAAGTDQKLVVTSAMG